MSSTSYCPWMWLGNVFSRFCLSISPSICPIFCASVCLSIHVSVCSGYNYWTVSHRNFIFGMEVYRDHIYIKFEFQGH